MNDQTQANTELSNAIENRNDPSYLEDVARERLGLVAPNDRVFYDCRLRDVPFLPTVFSAIYNEEDSHHLWKSV